jgi:hypothetical protein
VEVTGRLVVLLVAGVGYVDTLRYLLRLSVTLWAGKKHTHAHLKFGKGEAVWTMKPRPVSRTRERYYHTQLKQICQ